MKFLLSIACSFCFVIAFAQADTLHYRILKIFSNSVLVPIMPKHIGVMMEDGSCFNGRQLKTAFPAIKSSLEKPQGKARSSNTKW
jgi:hypothetical protein